MPPTPIIGCAHAAIGVGAPSLREDLPVQQCFADAIHDEVCKRHRRARLQFNLFDHESHADEDFFEVRLPKGREVLIVVRPDRYAAAACDVTDASQITAFAERVRDLAASTGSPEAASKVGAAA